MTVAFCSKFGKPPPDLKEPQPEMRTLRGEDNVISDNGCALPCCLVFTSTFSGLALEGKHAGTAFEMLGRLNPLHICRREMS